MRNFDDCYVAIQGWMVTMAEDLDLSLNEMVAYAVIYGFSQGGQGQFTGKIEYLQKWLKCSKPTAIATLKKLVDKNLVNKQEVQVNGAVKRTLYTAILPESTGKKTLPDGLKNLTRTSKESLPDGLKNFTRTGQNSLPASNIYNNTIDSTKENNNIKPYSKNIEEKREEESAPASESQQSEKQAVLSELIQQYHSELSTETPSEFVPLLEHWISKFGKDAVKFGFSISSKNAMIQWQGIRKWKYTKGIFHSWSHSGVTDLESAKRYQEQRERERKNNDRAGSTGVDVQTRPSMAYSFSKVRRY